MLKSQLRKIIIAAKRIQNNGDRKGNGASQVPFQTNLRQKLKASERENDTVMAAKPVAMSCEENTEIENRERPNPRKMDGSPRTPHLLLPITFAIRLPADPLALKVKIIITAFK